MIRGKAVPVVALTIVALLYFSSALIGLGYAENTGTYYGEIESSQMGMEYAMVELYNGDSVVSGPIFQKDLVYSSTGKNNNVRYSLPETVLTNGVYALKLTGTLSATSLVVSYGVGDIGTESKIPIKIALSSSNNPSTLTYQEIPVDGTLLTLKIDGVDKAPAADTPYYLFLKIDSRSNLTSKNTSSQDITLTFGATVIDHGAQYVSRGNSLVFKVTDIVQVVEEPEEGQTSVGNVSDGGTESLNNEQLPVANLTVSENTDAAVGTGTKTEFSVSVSNGNRFCIEYETSVFYLFVSTGSAEVRFTVTYLDSNEVKHELSFSWSSSDWGLGTKTEKGWLGVSANSETDGLKSYGSLSELDSSNGWIGDSGAHGMSITVSGVQSGTGKVIAKIVLR